MSIQVPRPAICETLPYDFSCPTVQGDVEPGRRICKVCSINVKFLRFKYQYLFHFQYIFLAFNLSQTCGMYFASISATVNHHRAVHSSELQPCVNRDFADGCPRRSKRIAAKIAQRDKEVLCRTIHPPTGGQDVEWLDEDEVPEDGPDEIPSTAASDDLPIVSDWKAWFANPFTPDD